MSQQIARQRCFNHSLREAVARCPECARCFCRECVTEHDDRVLCASCFSALARSSEQSPLRLSFIKRVVQLAFSFLLLWFMFYVLGQALSSLPASVHETAFWSGH